MLVFVTIAVSCAAFFVLTLLVFDHLDLADPLDFADDGGAGWFSLRNLLLFGLGFGAAGAIAVEAGYTTMSASFWGIGLGILLYLVGGALGVLLNSQESNSLRTLDTVIGKHGYVVFSIPNQFHTGEVQIGAQRYPARAATALSEGAPIVVTGYVGGVLVVERA